jgi:hypothetical protein
MGRSVDRLLKEELADMAQALFYMWEPFRKQLIAGHNFYVEQAQKRLLSQFQNMEAEADEYGTEWLNKCSQNFDPDRHDPDSFYEQAHDESIEFYQMLEDMLNRTRLSVVSGIFHEWDKQLRDWVLKEVNHWHHGYEVNKALWKANFGGIIDFLEAFGWQIRSKSYYTHLDKCRLVVNAYKHGDGDAFSKIKANYPEFIDTLGSSDAFYLECADHTALKIEDFHIIEFSNAIIEFWKDVPEYIWPNNESFNFPKWFEESYNKDYATAQKTKAEKS